MNKSVKYELSVMIHKREFMLSFCTMVAFCVLSFGFSALMQWGTDRSQLLSADALFVGSSYSSTWYYFVYLFAFVIVMPHSMSYINDIESGIFPLALVRSTKARYYLSKIIACFIGNIAIISIPFLINLFLCHLTFSSDPNYLFGEYGLPNYFKTILGSNLLFNSEQKIIPFINLFLYSSTLYNVMYIGFLSFAAGLLGIFVLCFSAMLIPPCVNLWRNGSLTEAHWHPFFKFRGNHIVLGLIKMVFGEMKKHYHDG